MISPADAEKMLAQLDSIQAEIGALKARLKVIEADLNRVREKIL